MASSWRPRERPLLVPLARTVEFLCQGLAVHTGKQSHRGLGGGKNKCKMPSAGPASRFSWEHA